MIARPRRENETPEGESYYISMTDMMVGVVFIFILLLTFFGLQYHETTVALTKADDPKTAVLLRTAQNLQTKNVALQIDYKNRIVCLPTLALTQGGSNPPGSDRRCFAYSSVRSAPAPTGAASTENRAALAIFIKADLAQLHSAVQVDAQNGALNFSADQLFLPGTDTLSPNGQGITTQVAKSLAARLPCYGFTPGGGTCPETPKMSAVQVAGNTSFNAFSAQGQQAWDLSLKRTVAFYRALVADQPILGQIRDAPMSNPAAQPLLRVASAGQSTASNGASTSEQTISVVFQMAQ